jgi:hypothetical protein
LETRRLLELVKRTIEHFDTLPRIWEGLKTLKRGWANDVLNNFPHHCSTSELTNIQDRLKMEAKAKLVSQSFGRGHLGEMIRIAEKLMELVDKITITV